MKVTTPHPVSGVIECSSAMTFGELARSAEQNGWSLDGVQPEPETATIGALLQRRQPRPIHWGCGLLPSRICKLVATFGDGQRYLSVRTPRKASGPDLAYLFIGAEGQFGTIESADFGLVRGAAHYIRAEGAFDDLEALFRAAREVTLLEPLSIRHLDFEELGIRVYVPVRVASSRDVLVFLNRLELDTEEQDELPLSERFRPDSTGTRQGAPLRLSVTYSDAARLLREIEKTKGQKRLSVRFEYADAHGLSIRFGGSRTVLERFEEKHIKSFEFNDNYDLTESDFTATEGPIAWE